MTVDIPELGASEWYTNLADKNLYEAEVQQFPAVQRDGKL